MTNFNMRLVCWLNVYLRPNGETFVGNSCWGSRDQADAMGTGLMGLKLVYRLRVTPKQVDSGAARA